MLLIYLAIFLALLACLFSRPISSRYLNNVKRYLSHGSALPGIRCMGWPLLGFLPYLSYSTAGFHDVLSRMVAMGGEDGMAYSWVGPSILVTLHDPNLIRNFLDQSERISRDHRILSIFSPAGSLKRMLGSSIFFYNDEKAKPLNSALRDYVGHRAGVARYYELAKGIARKHVERLVQDTSSQKDLVRLVDDFSADLWADAFFGIQETHTEDPQLATLISSLTRQSTSFGHLFKHLLWSLLHFQNPSLPSSEETHVGHSFDAIVAKRVEVYTQRASVKQSKMPVSDPKQNQPTPVFSRLLAQFQDTEPSSLVGEMWETAKVAVFSGSQSAKHFITWVTYELQRNRSVLKRLQNELTTVMPYGNLQNLSYEKFCAKTPLLDAILDETARLYAPSFALVRAVTEDLTLETPTGIPVTLCPGTIVMTTTQQMHTSKDIWGPSAMDWQPDRFVNGLNRNQRRAFMPTGYGVRSCPGSKLSMVGLKAYLMILLRNYEVELEDFEIVPGFVSATMMANVSFRVRECVTT